MNFGNNIVITFDAGDSYVGLDPEASEPRKERSKGEARAAAIEQFKHAARSQTIPNIRQTAQNLLGLLIQFKALGGSMNGDPLVNQLREAADFMEDL